MSRVADIQTEVVIVGGGPVGMGLAIELGQRGIDVVVVERYPTPQPIPKGQNLTQRTMEHFHFWGAEQALRAARTIPREYGIGGLTAYGTLLSGYHYDWLQRDLVRPYYFAGNERLPQYATEAVLRARVADLPSVRTLYGWSATGIDQDAEGVAVEATSASGSANVRAQFAVGCDGSRSATRVAAGITQTLSGHDRLMALLVFRSPELHSLLERFPGKSYYNVLHPDLEGYWQFFGRVDLGSTFFFHAPVPPGTTRDNFDFAAYLQRAVGAAFNVEFDHIGFWDLRFAIADAYRAGRVFIAGDAAHSHPPYGGYGINTGFEDARNLGWKLAATLRGWGSEALLDSYDAERRPVFASTSRDFIERSIENDRDFLARFNPASDAAAFEAEWKERGSGARDEVKSFEPNYRGSPIVIGSDGRPSALGSHDYRAAPGHHLAPARTLSGENVYEKLGDGFTLVCVGRPEAARQIADAAASAGLPLTVLQVAAGGETDRYGVPLILIRPDQFVAWTSDVVPDDIEAVLRQAIGR
jgi:2-polyprenyl-6-methoxyphenol hydroxylase-like FAD-dependent oxidoreductase